MRRIPWGRFSKKPFVTIFSLFIWLFFSWRWRRNEDYILRCFAQITREKCSYATHGVISSQEIWLPMFQKKGLQTLVNLWPWYMDENADKILKGASMFWRVGKPMAMAWDKQRRRLCRWVVRGALEKDKRYSIPWTSQGYINKVTFFSFRVPRMIGIPPKSSPSFYFSYSQPCKTWSWV